MLIGRKPTGSDQTLRQHDVSVFFIMSEEEEEENWKNRLFIKLSDGDKRG